MKKKVGELVTLWLSPYIQVQGQVIELRPKGMVVIDVIEPLCPNRKNYCGIPV